MKQRGSTLVILLLLLSLLVSISIGFYESSLQHFKASHHHLQRQQAFQQTEQCLTDAVQNKLNKITLHNTTLKMWSQSNAWWLKHGVSCVDDVWLYQQQLFLTADQKYIQLSAYHSHHIVLQMIVSINRHTGVIRKLNWADIS